MRYLSEFLWTHSWEVGTLVPNNSEFLTCNSNISILSGYNLLHLNTIVSLVGHLLRPLVLLLLYPGYIDLGCLPKNLDAYRISWTLMTRHLFSSSSTFTISKLNFSLEGIQYFVQKIKVIVHKCRADIFARTPKVFGRWLNVWPRHSVNF